MAPRQQRKCFEFVAADGQSEDREIDLAGTQEVEEGRDDFFDHGETDLPIFSRKSREVLRKKVRGDGRDHADRDGAANIILLLDDIAARCFEFTKDGAGPREKSLPGYRQAHRAAETVEEARAKLIVEFQRHGCKARSPQRNRPARQIERLLLVSFPFVSVRFCGK